MRVNLIQLLVLLVTFHLVEVVCARDATPIMISDQGTVRGVYLKNYRAQNVIAYLGLPYAQPPINERRFMPPFIENLPSWDGIRNASSFTPDCWQNPKRPLKKHDDLFIKLLKASHDVDETQRYDEDCLFLNIFIPDAPAPMEGYAVIVWLHSGDFSTGSSQDLDPFQLVFKQKVIVVTVSYRLGIFGYLTSLDGESPGNFGLMDQSAALLWTKRNIKQFGGNENSITLMGHGAGSVCVGLHLTSGEWSDGMFHRAIMMSGNSLSESAVRDAEMYFPVLNAFPQFFGCFRRPTSKLLECLRHQPAQILAEFVPTVEWGPIIDKDLSNTTAAFIPDSPRMLIERGVLRKVPLLIGFTDMEEVLDVVMGDMMTSGISPEMYDTLIADVIMSELTQLESNDSCGGNHQIVTDAVAYAYNPYPPVTDSMALRKMFVDYNNERKYIAPTILLAAFMSQQAPTYVYRFDIKARTATARDEIEEWVGVPHNFDLIFVWGMPYWSKQEMMNQWDNADKRVSDLIMQLWTNFAKFTDPTKFGLYITWTPFNISEQKILVIDRSFNMSDDHTINFRAIQFWNDYYPRVVMHAISCCNATNDGFFVQSSNNVHIVLTVSYMTITTLLLYNKVSSFT